MQIKLWLILILFSLIPFSGAASYDRVLPKHEVKQTTTKILVACLIEEKNKVYDVKKSLIAESGIKKMDHCVNHGVLLIEFTGTINEFQLIVDQRVKDFALDEKKFFIKQAGYGDIENFCEYDKTPDTIKE